MFDMFEDWFDGLSNMQAFWFIFAIVVASLGFIVLLAAISPTALVALTIILFVAAMAGLISFGILIAIREDV